MEFSSILLNDEGKTKNVTMDLEIQGAQANQASSPSSNNEDNDSDWDEDWDEEFNLDQEPAPEVDWAAAQKRFAIL